MGKLQQIIELLLKLLKALGLIKDEPKEPEPEQPKE